MVTPSAEGTEDAGGLGEFYGEEAFGGSVEHPAPLLLSQVSFGLIVGFCLS